MSLIYLILLISGKEFAQSPASHSEPQKVHQSGMLSEIYKLSENQLSNLRE
jgi:hypothetical protein